LKLATKAVKDWTEIAKNLWAKKLANEVNGINITLKQAWRAAYEIRDGVKGHHVKPVAKRFRNTNGTLANSPSENASIVEAHFNRVLNTQRPVADNAVALIRQRETIPELGLPPTWTEFKRAVFKLKNDKQPGSNVVLANAFKFLDNHNLTILYNFILGFWNGDKDYGEWHEGLGALVPKKGDLHELNQWRLINLMDMGSKVLSCIPTERAYQLLHSWATRSKDTVWSNTVSRLSRRKLHTQNFTSP
jgi:hypothetical protein